MQKLPRIDSESCHYVGQASLNSILTFVSQKRW